MDNHKLSNSRSPTTTGTSSPSPHYETSAEMKNGTSDVNLRRKKRRVFPDEATPRNFQRYASPQPILGMPNTSIAGVVSNELSAITASPVPLEPMDNYVYSISADEEDFPPPPIELLDSVDDYPRIRFSYGSSDSEQNLQFDDVSPEKETRQNLRVRRNDTGSSQSPPTSSLTEKSPSPPSSKSGGKLLRPISSPPSDTDDERRPPEDIKFRSIDFSKYKKAFRPDSSTDADVCSDGDVCADIHTPLLQEGGGSPVRSQRGPDSPGSASRSGGSSAGRPLIDRRESPDKRRSSSGSRRGSQSSQKSKKNGKRNGKDSRGSSKSVKSTFEPIDREDPWCLRADILKRDNGNNISIPNNQQHRESTDSDGKTPNKVSRDRVAIARNGRDRAITGNRVHPMGPEKVDPRDRFADARDSSMSTDSSVVRYPLSRQCGVDVTKSPVRSIPQRQESLTSNNNNNKDRSPNGVPAMGTQVRRQSSIKTEEKPQCRVERLLVTPQGYPLAQFPPGHFPPPPLVPRPDGLLPRMIDEHTDTGIDTPDPLTTPESALGYRPRYSYSQPRNIDRQGRSSPKFMSSASVDILLTDAVLPGSLSTGDLRLPKQNTSRSAHALGHVRSVPRDLYAIPGKMGSQQTNKSWQEQSAYSEERIEVDTMPSKVSSKAPVRQKSTTTTTTTDGKKRRFKHLRDRHYPICIAVSFATMLCINPPIGFIAVVFSYLSWKAYDRGDERTGFILARSALYTSLAGIIFTMTVVITTLYQTTIGI